MEYLICTDEFDISLSKSSLVFPAFEANDGLLGRGFPYDCVTEISSPTPDYILKGQSKFQQAP